jgi:hypothetical protein
MQDIDLDRFLDVNLLNTEASETQLVLDFLQNFSPYPAFCKELFNLLLARIDLVSEKQLSHNGKFLLLFIQTLLIGYEALIGMVKWAVPINPEQTLQHLMKVLYSKICLKKVSVLQTPLYVRFRTRSGFNSFPFDFTGFTKSAKNATNSSWSSSESQTKSILPLEEMKRSVLSDYHQFSVRLAKTNLMISEIRLFIGLGSGMENAIFKLIVKILGANDQLLYFRTFEE